jgi:hypothetical protein
MFKKYKLIYIRDREKNLVSGKKSSGWIRVTVILDISKLFFLNLVIQTNVPLDAFLTLTQQTHTELSEIASKL